MHIHLPKALHGWREFLKEYAIIVLGVLTALALEQAVELVHNHRLANEAREAIRQEMQTDIARVAYRLNQQACNEKRLDEIQELLTRWQGDDAFSAGLEVGFPGDAGLVDERWQANLASGRFNEESPEDQADQAGLYTLIHVIDSIENSEIDQWTQLQMLGLGSQAITLQSKPMIAAALARARGEGRAIKQLSGSLLSYTRKNMALGTFTPISPGTTCEPMRKPSTSSDGNSYR